MTVKRASIFTAGLVALAFYGTDAEAADVSAQASPSPPLSSIKLSLSKRWGGFSQPLYLTAARGDSGRLFVVEQGGRINLIPAVDRWFDIVCD